MSLRVPLETRNKRDVTVDDAEIYENAAVAADTITCSEVGQFLYFKEFKFRMRFM